MDANRRCEGKVALVTGGAAGIGQDCCERLAREGASLAILDQDIDGAEALTASLAEKGEAAIAIQVDVSDRAAATAAANRAAEHFGRLEPVVNNAGVGGTTDAFEDIPEEIWDRTIGINLSAVYYVMRAAFDPQ